MVNSAQLRLQGWINQREGVLERNLLQKGAKDVRHKCFISYHQADEMEVRSFIENFESVFIPKVLGASDEDDFIQSDDTGYVMDQIRERYLQDSTVTIVLVGRCTWARKYVDWEVYSTLRNDRLNRRSGLLAIELPSVAQGGASLPARVADNVNGSDGYARYRKYPTTRKNLQSWIEEAYQARVAKAHLIDNTRERRLRNASC